MLILLIIILIIHCILSYLLCNKEMLSPGAFCGGMYLFSCIVLLGKQNDWGIQIQADTIFIIYLFLIFILIGDLTISALYQKRAIEINQIDKVVFSFPKPVYFAIVCLEMVTMLLYFRQTVGIATQAGWSGNLGLLLQYARIAKNVHGIHVNSLAQYLSYVCEGINYVVLFCFVNNAHYLRIKKSQIVYYLIPIVLYIGIAVLSTGRTLLLRVFMFVIVVFILLKYKSNCWRKIKFSGIFRTIIIICVIAAYLFFMAGKLTGKSIDREFADYIAVYFSSGVAALNEYMKAPFHNTDLIWGGHTLFGIYTILRKFFNSIPVLSSPLEVISLGGLQTTNIYTPIRRYFQDFGYVGVVLIGVGIGAFYKNYYNRMKTESNPFKLLLFGYLFFPLVEIAIEERVFLDLLTLKTAIVVLVMTLLYSYCCKKEYLEGFNI